MSPCFSDGEGAELDVAGEFRNWAVADGRGRAFGPNAGFTLPDGSIRAADVSWIRWERWNALSDEQRRRSFARITPEFVIEVRSETDPLIHEDPSSVQGTDRVAGFEQVMQRIWG